MKLYHSVHTGEFFWLSENTLLSVPIPKDEPLLDLEEHSIQVDDPGDEKTDTGEPMKDWLQGIENTLKPVSKWTIMKLYVNSDTGSLYWINEDNHFCFVPLSKKSGVIDLDEDGGIVEYDLIADETLHDGTDIPLQDALREIEKKLRG